ncbi:hypothetical protein ABIB62_004553 [Mucilaginibacter sp. UYP25]|uniref:hypothetical protein n=1 Tax=unclassified Mucilaginibacter TaxID=2617802 RepID=UPI0032654FF4
MKTNTNFKHIEEAEVFQVIGKVDPFYSLKIVAIPSGISPQQILFPLKPKAPI